MSTTSSSLTIGQSSRSPSTTREFDLSAPPESNDSATGQRDRDVERQATETLWSHPHFCGRPQTIQFRCDNKSLTLCGCLPSYYLKQLAQEAVRKTVDSTAIEIVNEINVLNSVGEIGPVERINNAKSANSSSIRKPR